MSVSRFSRRRFGSLILAGPAVAALPWWLGSRESAASAKGLTHDGLPRSRPEDQQVDPQAILTLLDEVGTAGLELHSFMLYRRGHVVAEGWWWPYAPQRRHMMHSLTKSVTVTGVGLAVAEGHFKLDDKVVSFFKDELPSRVDDKLAAMTIRDLLTMRTGHDHETSGALWRPIRTSWVAEFFKIPVVYQPGTRFVYTSAASFMLSAIVTRTTGQTLQEYLTPRFFQPLGISDFHWDLGPGGINAGGNGLSWKTADSLKLGVLYARNGVWNGTRILREEWVRAALTPQIEGEAEDGNSYGYQWWVAPNKASFAQGMFTQLSIVFPEHDAVLAVTAAIDGSRHLLPLIWKHFPAAFGGGASAVSADSPIDLSVKRRETSLHILAPLVPAGSPTASRISGRTFNIEFNEDDVASVRFDFGSDVCVFHLRDARGEHELKVGLHAWLEGDTSMTGNKLHHEYQFDVMPVVAGGRWTDENTFEMMWQFVESAFRDHVVCRFEGEHMTLDRSVNVNSAATTRPTLRGLMNQRD